MKHLTEQAIAILQKSEYSQEDLQTLIIVANDVTEFNLFTTEQQPNPFKEKLIEIGLWNEQGTFYNKTYHNPVFEELSVWYDEIFC